MNLPLLVVTTVAQVEDARRLARDLIESKLVACVQIEPIQSIYRWRGELEEASEFRVLFKTQPALYARVEAAIRERHPYELPAIHAIETAHADAAYSRWVTENTTG
jgi:periplasmic divalent cation tolerance protein